MTIDRRCSPEPRPRARRRRLRRLVHGHRQPRRRGRQPAGRRRAGPTSQAPTESTDPERRASPPGRPRTSRRCFPTRPAASSSPKQSFDGASLGAAGLGMDTGELDPILKANGKTVADVRMAIASPADAAAGQHGDGLRVPDPGRGRDEAPQRSSPAPAPTSAHVRHVGGKQVLSRSGTRGVSVVIYTKGDVLFEVLLANAAVARGDRSPRCPDASGAAPSPAGSPAGLPS